MSRSGFPSFAPASLTARRLISRGKGKPRRAAWWKPCGSRRCLSECARGWFGRWHLLLQPLHPQLRLILRLFVPRVEFKEPRVEIRGLDFVEFEDAESCFRRGLGIFLGGSSGFKFFGGELTQVLDAVR